MKGLRPAERRMSMYSFIKSSAVPSQSLRALCHAAPQRIVTPSSLEEVVVELKKDSSSTTTNSKGELTETSEASKKKKNKIFDPRDKNRDGKVSQAEKLEAEQKKIKKY